METKTCNECGKKLPATLEYFEKDKTAKEGLRGKCRMCRKERRKSSYQTNQEKIQTGISPSRLLPNEAAEHIGCSYGKLMQMVRNGEIPHFRIGNRVFFMKEKLDEWLDEKNQDDSIYQNLKNRERIKMQQNHKIDERDYGLLSETINTSQEHKIKDITPDILRESAKIFEESIKAMEEAVKSIELLSKVLNVSSKIDEGLILQLMYVPERYRAFADIIENNKLTSKAEEALLDIVKIIKAKTPDVMVIK
ncbi:MAG: helix-turn-helix domain-containing protein [Candidatus Babeliales bacterium]|jgi:excisionase family DNA binding protein